MIAVLHIAMLALLVLLPIALVVLLAWYYIRWRDSR